MSALFVHPWALLLLLALPGYYALLRFADLKRAEALRRFVGLPEGAGDGGLLRHVVAAALALLSIAIAQPVQNARGAAATGAPDVVFLLDVSRSMFTRDAEESRIDQARQAINTLLSRVADQRFGLVVFAGNVSLECPLTNDYAFLRGQLRAASRGSVTVGGTRTGDAIRFAMRTAFDDASRNTRELVLISDGGDQGSSPGAAAGELEKHGIRLVVAGVGAASAPGFVPTSEVDSTPVVYRGRPVSAPLDEDALKDICRAASHCVYAGLPSVGFQQAILDRSSLFGKAGTKVTSMVGPLLALAAIVLLAADSVARRFLR